jgi:membrane protein YdbS with pleckstrin-like domain
MIVHPSAKLLKLWYLAAAALAAAIAVYNLRLENGVWWPLIVPAAIAAATAIAHARRRFTSLTIQNGKLRYESGILSRCTRTMEITKVQHVHCDQTLFQRIVSVGNLTLETAGETSRLTFKNIDDPHRVADLILEAAHSQEPKTHKA